MGKFAETKMLKTLEYFFFKLILLVRKWVD